MNTGLRTCGIDRVEGGQAKRKLLDGGDVHSSRVAHQHPGNRDSQQQKECKVIGKQ